MSAPQQADVVLCTPGTPCHVDLCEFCDPGGYLDAHAAGVKLLDTRSIAYDIEGQCESVPPVPVEPPPYLEWSNFMAEDFGAVEFLAGDLIQPGGQAALVGDGKAGKSLFALEWAQGISTGKAMFGAKPRPPRRVLYIDFENGWQDIQQRVASLGFKPGDLGGICYLSFPSMPPLDTPAGGAYVMERIKETDSEVVYFDTISRMIKGKENESDTWLDVYRHTMLRLKAASVAGVRLDHFGKDADKGARGSSAKTQDIDAVWELAADGRRAPSGIPIKLVRTHTRSGLGRDRVDLWRKGRKEQVGDSERWAPGETGHVLRAKTSGAEPEFLVAEHIADLADKAGIPRTAGRDTLRTSLPEQKHAKSVWEEAAKIRKSR